MSLPRLVTLRASGEVAPLFLPILVLLLFSDVSAPVAFRTALIVVYLALCGIHLMKFFIPTSSGLTKLALGTTCGLILWTLIDQALRTASFRSVSLVAIGALAIALNKLSKSNPDTRSCNFEYSHESPMSSTFTVALTTCVTLMLLAQVWYWLLIPACASLLVLGLLFFQLNKESDLSKSWITFGISTVFLGLVFGTTRRSAGWWLPKYGLDEMEYLSNAAFEWGPKMDVLAAGVRSGYQWFHFATNGLMEATSQSGDWVYSTRVDFVLSATLVALTVIAFFVESFQTNKQILLATTFAVSISTPLFYPNQFGLFAVNHRGLVAVFHISVLLAVVAWKKSQFAWRGLFPLFLLTFAYAASKTVSVIPLAACLTVVGFVSIYRKLWNVLLQLVALAAGLLGALMSTVTSGSGLKIQLSEPARFYSTYFGYGEYLAALGGSLTEKIQLAIGIITLLLGMSGLAWLTIAVFLRNRSESLYGFALGFSLFLGIVVAVFGWRLSDTHMHFLQIPVIASIPLSAVIATRTITGLNRAEKKPMQFLSGISATAGVTVVILSLGSTFNFSINNFENRHTFIGSSMLCLVLALNLVWFFGARLRTGTTRKTNSKNLVVSSLVVFAIVLGVGNWFTLPRQSLFKSGVERGQLGTIMLQDVATWVNKNTQSSEIFATDIGLVPGGCTGVASKESDSYITVVTLLKRRFVIVGPGIAELVSGTDPTSRVVASVKYACSASDISLRNLQNFGATWFLAYLPNLSNSLRSQVVFQSGDYGILAISKEN